MKEKWLNGWIRTGSSILIGTKVCCVGCGKCHGITCIAIEENYIPPVQLPNFPFNKKYCPVCIDRKINEFSIEEISKLDESILRKAFIMSKIKKNIETATPD